MSTALASRTGIEQRLATIEQRLATATSPEEFKEIWNRAEPLQRLLRKERRGRELGNRCVELRLRAGRRLGKMLAALPKRHGARPADAGLQRETPGLSALGITKTQSRRWQLLDGIPAVVFENYVASTKARGGELTVAGAIRLAKHPNQPKKKSTNDLITAFATLDKYAGYTIEMLEEVMTAKVARKLVMSRLAVVTAACVMECANRTALRSNKKSLGELGESVRDRGGISLAKSPKVADELRGVMKNAAGKRTGYVRTKGGLSADLMGQLATEAGFHTPDGDPIDEGNIASMLSEEMRGRLIPNTYDDQSSHDEAFELCARIEEWPPEDDAVKGMLRALAEDRFGKLPPEEQQDVLGGWTDDGRSGSAPAKGKNPPSPTVPAPEPRITSGVSADSKQDSGSGKAPDPVVVLPQETAPGGQPELSDTELDDLLTQMNLRDSS